MTANDWTFGALSHGLVRTGMLAVPGEVLMLASSRPGEGVSTVAAGVADACAQHLSRPVVLIEAGIDGAASAISMNAGHPQRIGYALPLDVAAWSDALGRFRAAHAAVIVDAGSLDSEAPAMWRPLVNRALLVIDMARARREALKRLGDELGRSTVRFDGFVANRKRFFIPAPVFRFIENREAAA